MFIIILWEYHSIFFCKLARFEGIELLVLSFYESEIIILSIIKLKLWIVFRFLMTILQHSHSWNIRMIRRNCSLLYYSVPEGRILYAELRFEGKKYDKQNLVTHEHNINHIIVWFFAKIIWIERSRYRYYDGCCKSQIKQYNIWQMHH
jgi:hypothetical protein